MFGIPQPQYSESPSYGSLEEARQTKAKAVQRLADFENNNARNDRANKRTLRRDIAAAAARLETLQAKEIDRLMRQAQAQNDGSPGLWRDRQWLAQTQYNLSSSVSP
jgi:hypothetical protein